MRCVKAHKTGKHSVAQSLVHTEVGQMLRVMGCIAFAVQGAALLYAANVKR